MLEEKAAKNRTDSAKFMDVREIVEVLQEQLPDCPEEFLEEIAGYLRKYAKLLKLVFASRARFLNPNW